MNTFAKAAIAAIVVLAIGVVGLSALSPRTTSNVGGPPSASPSASPSPSPSSSPVSSAPPPLTSSFTSRIHGISMSYPAGWATSEATQAWTGGGVNIPSPDIDYLYDRQLFGDLFIGLASQPLGGKTGDQWVADFFRNPESDCTAGTQQPITVAGATGSMCDSQVAVSVADRGYFIRLYTSGDQSWLGETYDAAWFRQVLATVQFHPADATDPSAPPSASPSS